MKVKIEKGIPIAKITRVLDYEIPFEKMEVGDSFLLDCSARDRSYILSKARWHYSRTKQPYRFASKTVEGGYRFWKIEK
jgi:hypothetical protein